MKIIGRKYRKQAKEIKEQILVGNYKDEEDVIITFDVKNIENYESNSTNDFIIYCCSIQDEETNNMYLANMFAVGIQKMRKEAGLKPFNPIKIYYHCSKELTDIFKKYYNIIYNRIKYDVINNGNFSHEDLITYNKVNDVDVWIIKN